MFSVPVTVGIKPPTSSLAGSCPLSLAYLVTQVFQKHSKWCVLLLFSVQCLSCWGGSWTCVLWLYFFLYSSFHPTLTLLFVYLQLSFSSAAFSVFFTLNHQIIDRWNFAPGPHKDRRQWKTAGTVTWIFQMNLPKVCSTGRNSEENKWVDKADGLFFNCSAFFLVLCLSVTSKINVSRLLPLWPSGGVWSPLTNKSLTRRMSPVKKSALRRSHILQQFFSAVLWLNSVMPKRSYPGQEVW